MLALGLSQNVMMLTATGACAMAIEVYGLANEVYGKHCVELVE